MEFITIVLSKGDELLLSVLSVNSATKGAEGEYEDREK